MVREFTTAERENREPRTDAIGVAPVITAARQQGGSTGVAAAATQQTPSALLTIVRADIGGPSQERRLAAFQRFITSGNYVLTRGALEDALGHEDVVLKSAALRQILADAGAFDVELEAREGAASQDKAFVSAVPRLRFSGRISPLSNAFDGGQLSGASMTFGPVSVGTGRCLVQVALTDVWTMSGNAYCSEVGVLNATLDLKQLPDRLPQRDNSDDSRTSFLFNSEWLSRTVQGGKGTDVLLEWMRSDDTARRRIALRHGMCSQDSMLSTAATQALLADVDAVLVRHTRQLGTGNPRTQMSPRRDRLVVRNSSVRGGKPDVLWDGNPATMTVKERTLAFDATLRGVSCRVELNVPCGQQNDPRSPPVAPAFLSGKRSCGPSPPLDVEVDFDELNWLRLGRELTALQADIAADVRDMSDLLELLRRPAAAERKGAMEALVTSPSMVAADIAIEVGLTSEYGYERVRSLRAILEETNVLVLLPIDSGVPAGFITTSTRYPLGSSRERRAVRAELAGWLGDTMTVTTAGEIIVTGGTRDLRLVLDQTGWLMGTLSGSQLTAPIQVRSSVR